VCGETAPPAYGGTVVAPRGGIGREALDGHSESLAESRALGFYPALKARGVSEEEAVQKRPAVERRRLLQRPVGERLLEQRDVGLHDVRVQSKRVRADQSRVAELAAHTEDQLIERVARAFERALRPQVGGDLLTGETALIARRQECEQRETSALAHHACADLVPQTQAAEHLEPQHGVPAEGELRGR